EGGEGMDLRIVAAADDGALAVLRHDEGQRGRIDLARMDRDPVLGTHVLKHASEPVVGDGRNQVGHDPELGAAECRGYGVAAERHGVGVGDMLLVACRQMISDEGDVDIGLSDKEGLHKLVRHALLWLRFGSPRHLCGLLCGFLQQSHTRLMSFLVSFDAEVRKTEAPGWCKLRNRDISWWSRPRRRQISTGHFRMFAEIIRNARASTA